VDEDDGDVVGKTARQAVAEQMGLDARAAETFDAVRSGGEKEDTTRTGRSEARLVEKEWSTVGSRKWMSVRASA
jgi:hypothetical protein